MKKDFTRKRPSLIFTLMDEYKNTLDDVFFALAHPARRKMLELLASKDLCVTELADEFSSSLNVVSKHIQTLERAGLVQRDRDGRVHQLHLNAAPLAEASSFVERYRARWERQLDRLDAYLNTMAQQEKKRSKGKTGNAKSKTNA